MAVVSYKRILAKGSYKGDKLVVQDRKSASQKYWEVATVTIRNGLITVSVASYIAFQCTQKGIN